MSFCLASVAYIVNIHVAHSYWKQGALGAAVSGVRCVWAGAGPQRMARIGAGACHGGLQLVSFVSRFVYAAVD